MYFERVTAINDAKLTCATLYHGSGDNVKFLPNRGT